MPRPVLQTYFILMLIALTSVIFGRQDAMGWLRSSVQGLLLPVTQPMHVVAAWVHADPQPTVDATKTPAQWAAENEQLRLQVINLQGQLAELAELQSERDRLGKELRNLCTPMKVTGIEAGSNDLLVNVPVGESAEVGDPVLHAGRLVGRIRETGVFGARVRVLTDERTQLAVTFGRWEPGVGFVEAQLAPPPPDAETIYGYNVLLVEGNGHGELVTDAQPLQALDGVWPVKVGDLVVLNDPREWPPELARITVGTVSAVKPRTGAAGFADVVIQPAANMRTLSEVQVMNR